MKQKTLRTISDALDLATKAIAGVTDLGAGGPKYNTATAITGDQTALVTSRNGYENAEMVMSTRRGTLDSVAATAYAFAIRVRDHLKPTLGNQYSSAWDAVGFVGSLQASRRVKGLKVLLPMIVSYFTTVPTAQSTEGNLTAERAQQIYDDLVDAENDVLQQKAIVGNALKDKKAKLKALIKRLRGLAKELAEIFDPLDPRWLACGLNKPGASATPDVPANLLAVLIGPNAVALKWDRAARAEHYRIWKKVVGVDDDYIAVDSRTDLDCTIEGLPGNATIEIAVSAVNNGGESAKSAKVVVQTT